MSPSRWFRVPVVAITFAGCASTTPAGVVLGTDPLDPGSALSDRPTPMPAPPPVIERCTAQTPHGVRREAVVRVVDTGLGFWLRGVSVAPRLDAGRFRGWIVRRFYPGDVCYTGVDIREGDVVTKINGRSVEREGQAHDVFVGLRTASVIVVDYEREGVPKTLRLAIVDR